MRCNPLQLNVRRIPGRIDLCYEVLKEPSSSKDSNCRQVPRESGHSLKLFRNHDDFYFVEVNRPLRVIEYAAEFFFNAVFDSLNAE